MKKRLKKQEKRIQHKAVYMAQCVEYNLPYNVAEESFIYQNEMNHIMAKSHGKDKDEEVVLPLRITLGVTLSLAGFFLYLAPFPPCKAAGQILMETGMGFLISYGVDEYENQQKS